jgi:hypothetical protein
MGKSLKKRETVPGGISHCPVTPQPAESRKHKDHPMSTISENAKAIFLEAVEKHSPEEWPEFLDQACGEDDRELRGHVEGLLQAHCEKDSLFDRSEETRDYQPLVRPGR